MLARDAFFKGRHHIASNWTTVVAISSRGVCEVDILDSSVSFRAISEMNC
jgi:hypothetical protein